MRRIIEWLNIRAHAFWCFAGFHDADLYHERFIGRGMIRCRHCRKWFPERVNDE